MKLYSYLIVLLLIATISATQLRHKSKAKKVSKNPNGDIDWTKEVVGPHSPQQGVLMPGEGDLTDNWNTLMNDKSKKMISLGIPNEVDMNQNIALGASYEDVEYVKDKSPPETPAETIANVKQEVWRMNKKSDKADKSKKSNAKDLPDTYTPEEHALEDLVAVEFDRDVTDAAEAFNNIMRHQDQIVAFLDSIEKVERLSEHQYLVVAQLVKYIKLVTGAHEDLKAEETEDDIAFLNEIGSRIRQYTFGVDSQNYNGAKLESQERPLVGQHQYQNDRVVRQLDFQEEYLVEILKRGESYRDEQLRQAEQLERLAQKASKVMQTYWVLDEIKRFNVLREGPKQKDLATDYKRYVRSESSILHTVQDGLETLEQQYQNFPEPDAAKLENWRDSPEYYVNEASIVNYNRAIHALSLEEPDMNTVEEALGLNKEYLRSKIAAVSNTISLVQSQVEQCMGLEDAVMGENIHKVEDIMVSIADDTFDNQVMVAINPKITKSATGLKETIRREHLTDAMIQVKQVMAIVYNQNYPSPSQGQLDHLSTSMDERVALNQDHQVVGLDALLHDALVAVEADNFQEADQLMERTADRAQQVSKIMRVQAVVQSKNFKSGIESLQTNHDLEKKNLLQDQTELQNTHTSIAQLIESAAHEGWKSSSTKVAEIIDGQSLNAETRYSLFYAKKYIDQDDIGIAQRHLAHALHFTEMDLNSLARSLESMDRQEKFLGEAHHNSGEDDQSLCTDQLLKVIDEVNFHQPVTEVDEQIEAKATDAKEALDQGDAELAGREMRETVAGLLDPLGGARKEASLFPMAVIQTEQRGSYVDGHQGEDIRDVNLSVDQVDHAKELTDVEQLVNLINSELEEMHDDIQLNGWLTNPHKLEAERQLERLYALAQRDYKLIDLRLTQDKVNNVIEAQGETDALVSAVEELEASNKEEEQSLEAMAHELQEFREEVSTALNHVHDDALNNKDTATVARALVAHQHANVAIMSAVEQADKYLDANKVLDAEKRLNYAVEQITSMEASVSSSLQSIASQNDALKVAGDQAKDGYATKLRDTLSALEKQVVADQSTILTDLDCTKAFNEIREFIYEGKAGEAAQHVTLLGETLANELRAQKDFQHRAPEDGPSAEVQEAQAQELETAVLQAEDSIDGGNRQDAEEAIDTVLETTQEDAKVKLVEMTKEHVEEAVESGHVEEGVEALKTLEGVLENEEKQLEDKEKNVEETKEDVSKAVEEEGSVEESQEDAEELEQDMENNKDVPAEVQNELEDAKQAADEGDLKEYEHQLEQAEDTLDQEGNELKKSQEAVESQEESVHEAEEALEKGDDEAALHEIANIEQSVKQDQPRVHVSEEAEEKAQKAKEAVRDGDVVEAVEEVEDIVSSADEDVSSELGDEVEETEIKQGDEFVEGLEKLADSLAPEDPALIDQDDLMHQVEELAQQKRLPDGVDEALEGVRVAVKSQDYESAIAQVEELLEQVQGDLEEEGEEGEEAEDEEKDVAEPSADDYRKKSSKKQVKKVAKQVRKAKVAVKKVAVKTEANKKVVVKKAVPAIKKNLRRHK